LPNLSYRTETWKRLSPPSRRGGRADLRMQRYLKNIGAAGEVKALLQHVSDLPRRAESRVAWHLLDRRSAPSSKEGFAC